MQVDLITPFCLDNYAQTEIPKFKDQEIQNNLPSKYVEDELMIIEYPI